MSAARAGGALLVLLAAMAVAAMLAPRRPGAPARELLHQPAGRRSRIDGVGSRLGYVLDLAEIPTFQLTRPPRRATATGQITGRAERARAGRRGRRRGCGQESPSAPAGPRDRARRAPLLAAQLSAGPERPDADQGWSSPSPRPLPGQRSAPCSRPQRRLRRPDRAGRRSRCSPATAPTSRRPASRPTDPTGGLPRLPAGPPLEPGRASARPPVRRQPPGSGRVERPDGVSGPGATDDRGGRRRLRRRADRAATPTAC